MSKVFVSIPIMDKPELRFIHSLYQTIFSQKQHECRMYCTEGDSLISRVRNVHMSIFYYDFLEYDYFMSVDSDLGISNCTENDNLITKLIDADKDIVGGCYAVKQPGVLRSSSVALDHQPLVYNSGLQEMLWLSTGCWMVKRSTVKRMIEAYPELTYIGDDTATGKTCHALYQPMLYDVTREEFPKADPTLPMPFKKYLSEDWSWCARWRQIGGKLWADTSVVLTHYGKMPYRLFTPSKPSATPKLQQEIVS